MNQHARYNLANNAYRSAAVTTSPLAAVVMLYDAAIASFGRTITALEQRQFEEAFNHLDRATTILRGLCYNLNFEKGGAFAERMRDTYISLIMSALNSLGKPDAVPRYRKLIAALTGLREAWADVRVQVSKTQSTRP